MEKTAKTQSDAFDVFEKHNENDGFIQWKGTDVCMDFHCECGHANHYDGYFAYQVKCYGCGNIYAPSSSVEMVRLTASDGDGLKSLT